MLLHASSYVEALLYMSIPLVVHVLLTPRPLRRVLRRLKALVLGDPDRGYVVREISAETILAYWSSAAAPAQALNHMLQRALVAHLAGRMALDATRTSTLYQLVEKPLELLLAENKPLAQELHDASAPEKAPGSDEEKDRTSLDYSYEQLRRLHVTASPAAETWAEVDCSCVFFQFVVIGNGESTDEDPAQHGADTKKITMTFRLRSKRADASQAIDRLVDEAFFHFQKTQILATAQDTARYLFVQTTREDAAPPAAPRGEADGTPTVAEVKRVVLFKRYPLGEDKTFRSLFFEDKPRVLHLLDDFTSRTGKFGVKGFPYKLGLLLHGPPGTGKTSIIKAVAEHTRRHVVTVSLATLETNQQLMDAMFERRFPVDGRELPIELDFRDVVFVMEDIDCAGASVVYARGDAESRERQRETTALARSRRGHDKLNLSGLLNVLDGVIDCPGRIVIMTTNHPEKLDPALARPGRVTAQICLGAMAAAPMEMMLEYYFREPLSPQQRQRVHERVEHAPVTPAEVEQVCAEHATLGDAVRALSLA